MKEQKKKIKNNNKQSIVEDSVILVMNAKTAIDAKAVITSP
jgi:hypothetical protein